MRPGEVRYLLLLLMFGNTYFCRFEEVLGLNPAFRAVFNNVFLANPLENYIKLIINISQLIVSVQRSSAYRCILIYPVF